MTLRRSALHAGPCAFRGVTAAACPLAHFTAPSKHSRPRPHLALIRYCYRGGVVYANSPNDLSGFNSGAPAYGSCVDALCECNLVNNIELTTME